MQLIYFYARAIFIAKSIKIMDACVRERKSTEKREVICLITNTVIIKTQEQKKYLNSHSTTYLNKHAL
jgi:hypothetical protein